MSGTRSWTFDLIAPDGQVPSANADHRVSRWEVSARRAQWRHDAFWLARVHQVPKLTRVRVDLVIHVSNWRIADSQNYPSASAVKGLLDGLVVAGVVPDDRGEHMQVTMPTLAGLDGGLPRVRVTITDLEVGM